MERLELRLVAKKENTLSQLPKTVYSFKFRSCGFEDDTFIFDGNEDDTGYISWIPILGLSEEEKFIKEKIRENIKKSRELLDLYEKSLDKDIIYKE